MADAASILNQAQARAAGGDPDGARRELARLLEAPMERIQPLLAGAYAAFQLGDAALAEGLSRRAIKLRPDAPYAYLNMGNALMAQGRLAEAEDFTRAAINWGPSHAPSHANLGHILAQLGRPDEAEAAYRNALALTPGDPSWHDALGLVLGQQGRPDEAMAAFRAALAIDRDHVSAEVNLGNLFLKGEHLAEAEKCYVRALSLDSSQNAARINLALVRQRQGALGEAIAELHVAADQAPDDATVWINLATMVYDSGDPAAAVAHFDRALAIDPRNGTALAFKAVALNQAGERAAGGALVDLDRFIAVRQIAVPPGYDDIAAFNAALCDQAASAPDRHGEPATDKGRQTRDLLARPSGALAAYGEIVDAAVRDYRDGLADDPGHPFLAARPEAWELTAWATIMRRVDPGEDTHFHPTAWLSGVYYARLPDEAAIADDPAHAGWIEFGRPPNHIQYGFEPDLKLIRPQPGLLVLFPSYFYHRVMPFTGSSERMSIAFDATPAQPGH